MRTFRVYDENFNLIVSGKASHCAKVLGMKTEQIYRGAEQCDRNGGLSLGYYFESADMPPEETEIPPSVVDVIKQWDDFVEPSKWISVEDRLPTEEDANPNESVFAIEKHDGFARSWCWDVVERYPQEFTHWMPLPEPPGEVADGQ